MGQGYCYSRDSVTSIPIEDLITTSELMLKLHALESTTIDRLFYRYSTNKHLTKSQFSQVCNKLGIDLESKEMKSFFFQFYNSKGRYFEAKQLSTLGILLGKGTKETKIRLLFENYDENINFKMSREELSEMFNDISIISFKYLPNHALNVVSQEARSAIKIYSQDLMNMKASVIKFYVNLVFDEEGIEEIEMSMFFKILKDSKIVSILNPGLFRKYTLGIFSSIEKAVKAVNYILDETKADSSQVYEKIKVVDWDREVHFKVRKSITPESI